VLHPEKHHSTRNPAAVIVQQSLSQAKRKLETAATMPVYNSFRSVPVGDKLDKV